MYTTYRSFFRYGNESDYVDITVKEFPTIEKAISYAHRYAKGIRFCSVEVEDENGEVVYELMADGTVCDYRNSGRQKAR